MAGTIQSDDLEISINEDCIVFEDECGSRYAIDSKIEDDKLIVDINDFIEGLNHLGVSVRY